MRRYGRDYYDAGYRPRGGRPGRRPRYDHGYRGGWGMSGLNASILHGPRPEHRGYDPAFHGGPRGGPRHPGRDLPPPRRFEPNPRGRLYVPRLPFDARTF